MKINKLIFSGMVMFMLNGCKPAQHGAESEDLAAKNAIPPECEPLLQRNFPKRVYQAPEFAKVFLGDIADHIKKAETAPFDQQLYAYRYCSTKARIVDIPAIGDYDAIIIEADMDVDTDGAKKVTSKQDRTRQATTSLFYKDKSVAKKDIYIDAGEVPYYVLPGKKFAKWEVSLGDVAAVIGNVKGIPRLVFAIFADVGPTEAIGEASLALAQELGHKSIKSGIPEDVLYVVFPGSYALLDLPTLTPENIGDRINRAGSEIFTRLGGNSSGALKPKPRKPAVPNASTPTAATPVKVVPKPIVIPKPVAIPSATKAQAK